MRHTILPIFFSPVDIVMIIILLHTRPVARISIGMHDIIYFNNIGTPRV